MYTKLEKCLLPSFLITVLMALGLITLIAITFTGRSLCKTPTCISSSYEILNNIDPTVNPCEDFFAFACGKFIKRGEQAKLERMNTKIRGELDKLMEVSIHANDHYLVKNQKKLFQVCMNETTNEEDSLETFKEILSNFSGWPVIVGNDWDESLFDWKTASYKLRQSGLMYASMVEFSLEPDPLNTSYYLLQIKEPFVDFIEDEQKISYLNFMVGSVILFGADRTLAKNDIEDVFEFRQRLYNVTTENDWDSNNITEGLQQKRLTVKSIQDQNNYTNWIEFINDILKPVKHISDNDYVMFSNKNVMKALIEFLDSTPKRVQANYILWTVYESLVNFFPKQYQELEQNYKCQTDHYVNHKSRIDQCRRIVRLSFDVIPTEMMYAEQKLTVEFRQNVSELIKNIKEEFISLLRNTKWMDEASVNLAVKKANAIVEVIGVDSNYQSDPAIKLFNSNKNILTGNYSFLSLYLANQKLLTDMSYARINAYCYNYIFNKFASDVNAAYLPEGNTLALHLGILQEDIFDPVKAKYRNYGMLGLIIGHEITHGFCKDGSVYNGDGETNSIWTNATKKAYETAIKCIVKEAESFDIYGTNLKMNGTRTLEENIADLVGVKASYNAYTKWVSKNGDEESLRDLYYTPYQLFWISTASHYCHRRDKKGTERLLRRDNHALDEFRVINPLKNNKEFAKDFKCPLGSKMNPSEKCEIFGVY